MNNQCTQVAELPNIDDVLPLNEQDEACLSEVRTVLQKHNRADRFGVSLLHGHFHIADDEILLESCNVENRTLTSTPVKRSTLAQSKLIETNWRLDTGATLAYCTAVCKATTNGHVQDHSVTR